MYFSATGNTERVAEVIADTTGGELFELEPVDPYTDEDLNYNDDNSRVSQEYADEGLRNVELVADTVDGWQDVERVYIGYPIWWGNAAWPVNAFVEANDFTGKTVIPFCTSASSLFGRKDSHLSLATHSGILSSYPSTAPSGTASSVLRMLLYHSLRSPRLRCCVSAPDIFGAGTLD